MKHTFTLYGVWILMFFLMIRVPVLVTGQEFSNAEYDPNLDQIPFSLLMELQENSDAAPLSSTITISNWDNFNLGVDFAEGNIAENPAMPTWYFTAYNTNGTYHTQDGHNWSRNNPSFGVTVRGDPVQVYDSLGNLYYENMYGSPNILGCMVAVSTDNGATWGPIEQAISGVDKNWITADQTSGPYANYVYTTMTANSGGNFARSTDQGQTWTNTWNVGTQNLPGMMVCVGPNQDVQGGSVYVVTNSGNTFTPTYYFYRSLDGGSTFSLMSNQSFAGYVGSNVGGRHAVQNMRTRPYPFIAADNSYGPNRGRLYCVYATNDPPGSGNKPDIWSRYSDNDGTTWSSAVRVNDDVNPTQHHQWHPAIWCDKETGRLYIQWMDTRDTPTSDSALIYATYSEDGGVTFAGNQQISNKKMKIDCASCGGGGTPRYQGDYNGIVSNSKVSMLAWTDFRNGNFMSATAYFPDFAMSIDRSADTLYTPFDTTTFTVSIPGVKLYDDTVVFSGTIFPVPPTGSITFSFPQGTELTAFPGSLPVKLVLNGGVPEGNYTATFETKGPNGTPVHRRTATIRVILGGSMFVNATATPDTICQGMSSQLNASVSGGTSPFTYQWTPVTGLSDPTLHNPVASHTETITYQVTVTDGTLETATDSVTVTVLTAPPSPGAITGNTTACSGATEPYEVNTIPGALSYSWTVPADATIISGQNSPEISVLWGDTSGIVSIVVGNACGNSPPRTLPVTVLSLLPQPGAIFGPELGCTGIESEFYITEVPGAESYIWSVPADAEIVLGQGTTAVTILWGSTSGEIAVVAENVCGSSPPKERSLTAGSIPATAGPISGNDTVCVNHAGYLYQVEAIAAATSYIWTLPPGASIASGLGTREITVDFGPEAVSGTIEVYGMNDCGQGTSSGKLVTVSDCPGIGENDLRAVVEIYPNPTDNQLFIRIRGSETKVNMQILDVTGAVRYSETWSQLSTDAQKALDLSGLASGVYFLRLNADQRCYTDKIVIR